MKNISTILTSTLILLAIACGGGGSSLEKQKASLASLKKESLSLNAKIASLESAIAKAGPRRLGNLLSYNSSVKYST